MEIADLQDLLGLLEVKLEIIIHSLMTQIMMMMMTHQVHQLVTQGLSPLFHLLHQLSQLLIQHQ